MTFIKLATAPLPQIISTTCQWEDPSGNEQWMTCPYDANRAPMSVDEIWDNKLSSEEEQKYCCGDKQHR